MTDNPEKNSIPEPAPDSPQAAPDNPQAAPDSSQAAPDSSQAALEQTPPSEEHPAAEQLAAQASVPSDSPATAPAEPAAQPAVVKKPAEKKTAAEKPTSADKKISGEKKPAAQGKAVEKPVQRKRATPGALFAALGLMLLEVLLPVILTAVLLWWIFATFNLWSYGRTLAVIVFAVGMVAFSLLLSIMFDSATRSARKKQRSAGVRFTSAPLTRLVKLVVGGVVLPLALFAAANWVPLSTPVIHGTAMNYIITTSAQPVKLAPPDAVGSLALSSKDPATKVLSIQVLQGFKSSEALGQLLRMADEDNTALTDPSVADALSTAIAAYGKDARDPLIALFRSVQPNQAGAATAGDAYASYFSASFDRLKAEIKASALTPEDQSTRLAEIDAAAAQLKNALKDVPAEKVSGDPRPDFALKTLLAMNLAEDPDLLSFAKSVAADRNYPASIRGSALLLIGKLGAKNDLDTLYPYLKESDPIIQTHALQAIAALQTKLSGAPANPPQ